MMLSTFFSYSTTTSSPDINTTMLSAVIVPLHVPEVLTEYERDEVKHLVEDVLPLVPADTVRSLKYLKLIHRKVFNLEYRDELASIGRRTLLRRILNACVVRQVIINDGITLPSTEQLHEMPFYEDADLIPTSATEIDNLRHFMRAVQTMHMMGMPAVNNKKTYIDVAAMLEGSNRTYSTGGTPSRAIRRRVMIYHGVTGTEIPRCNTTAHQQKRRKVSLQQQSDHEDYGEELEL
jgi:hypothetical protein